MKKIALLLLCAINGLIADETFQEWHYIPFDDAMQKEYYPDDIIGNEGQAFYRLCRNLYECNNLSVLSRGKVVKIPKIIHQYWGQGSVPEAFRELQQSWIEHHLGRDWYYRLWTDEDIMQFGLYNQEFYNATDNWAVKSDIARLEILYRFGGVWADMDYECLRAVDILHYTYDFYIGLQPLDSFFVQVGTAIIGACPGHPILKHCIETIKDDWHLKGATKKTGPLHVTKSVTAVAGTTGLCDMVFPAFYFYPLGCQCVDGDREWWTRQGAFGIHWWAKSWMPKNYRRSRFRDIDNDASVASWND